MRIQSLPMMKIKGVLSSEQVDFISDKYIIHVKSIIYEILSVSRAPGALGFSPALIHEP